jgi:hypothetical protein
MVNAPTHPEAGPTTHWRQPLLEALLISAVILGLFYYWFGVANRFSIFLYGHAVTGVAAQPFDKTTSGRYWMSGLVAAGIVMILYIAANWLRARLAVSFRPSTWWHVWAFSLLPVGIGVPVITMTVNSPTLPPALAAACAVSAMLGLAVALLPGKWAAERPLDVLWLLADSLGLVPPLVLLHAVEFTSRRSAANDGSAWILVGVTIVIGMVWLVGVGELRLWRRKGSLNAATLFLAGIALSYLVLPLLHYILFTPPDYRYISAAENFFASSIGLQALAFGVAAAMAIAVTRVRRWLDHRASHSEQGD